MMTDRLSVETASAVVGSHKGGDTVYQVSIKAARVNADLSMQQAAQLLGITERTLYEWERGKRAIPFDAIKTMCSAYNVPIELLRL